MGGIDTNQQQTGQAKAMSNTAYGIISLMNQPYSSGVSL